jgi:isopentenyl diphosphate isomerase/L-lactate dehydrogenase-like FMN-dependent dehydrogenase
MSGTPRHLEPPRVVNIEDLRRLAQQRLPKVIFDYLDGGAEDEITLRENSRAFQEVYFRPRQAVATPKRDLRTKVLGTAIAFPALLAPVGYSRMMHPDGEAGAARAAGAAGTGYILSTISGYKLEDVRAATKGPCWFQLYMVGGREVAEDSIARAKQAGYGALVVTVDTPIAGMRERDSRNGMKQLMGKNALAKLPYIEEFLAHPRWLAGFLRDGGMPKLENIVVRGKGALALLDVTSALARTMVTWEDFKWMREIWTGPIVAKGVMIGDDARRAVDAGCAGVIVSNHGGRQLDCCDATLRVLPEVVAAVRGQAEVLVDGGVRRGGDIAKAICLGAKAVLIGRAYAYGLAAAGEAGVTRALQILREDLDRTLALIGCETVAGLDSSYVEMGRLGLRRG